MKKRNILLGALFVAVMVALATYALFTDRYPLKNPFTEDTTTAESIASKIEYVFDDSSLYIRHKGKIFTDAGARFEPAEILEEDELGAIAAANWKELSIDAPASDDSVFSTVFDVRKLNESEFILVMIESAVEADSNTAQKTILQTASIYLAVEEQGDTQVSMIQSFKRSKGDGYWWPLITEVRSMGDIVAMNLYKCRGCGGHTPQLGILSIDDASNGQTTYTEIGTTDEYTFLSDSVLQYRPHPEVCDTRREAGLITSPEQYSTCVDAERNELQTITID